jgi:non-specific serine/threonine protein kinase
VEIVISPNYGLYIENQDNIVCDEFLEQSFKRGTGFGLLALDASSSIRPESDFFWYWKDFVRIYLALFAATPDLETRDLIKNPVHIGFPEIDINHLLLTVPLAKGSEYINIESLKVIWGDIEKDLHVEIQESGKSISEYFSVRHSNWNLLGRVCFHLAENKNSKETPFAFLATYAHQISKEGKTKHLPLGRALEEYSGIKNKTLLLRLLAPIHKATIESDFLREVVNSGSIYHPQAWSPNETYKFLKDIPLFEKAGIVAKVPNWWKPKNPTSPQISINIGDKKPGGIGLNALRRKLHIHVVGNVWFIIF